MKCFTSGSESSSDQGQWVIADNDFVSQTNARKFCRLMSAEHTSDEEAARFCTRAACCPVCGGPNRCRMETGELYKGPCWCVQPTLSGAALHRLLADSPEPRCLCQSCLEAIATDPEITWDELVTRNQPPLAPPVLLDGDTYQEGTTIVFTAQFHLRRGYCCGNGCRHCPYGTAAASLAPP